MSIGRRIKIVALITLIATATVLGVLMLTAYASSEPSSVAKTGNICLPERKEGIGWLSNLAEEQREELKALVEEFQSTLQAKLKEWSVEAPAPPNPTGFRGFGPMSAGRGYSGFLCFQLS